MMKLWERDLYTAHLKAGGKKMKETDWIDFINEKLERDEEERREREEKRRMALSPKSRAKEDKAWADQF